MTPARILGALAFAAVASLAAGPAAADPVVTYPSSGSADGADGDARTRALDAAFAGAVTEAVADLAGKNARTQAAAVDREIVKRARRFVASFSVTREGARGDRFEVEVDVRVDQGKLSARLVELGVVLRSPDATPPEPPVVQRRKGTVLYRVVGAGPTAASFGAGARADVIGLDALAGALGRAGYTVVPASAAGPAPADDGTLPVDDAGARALAGDVGAEVALVVGVAVGPVGPVRGAPISAAPARAWLHLVDVKTEQALRDVEIATAAWGDSERTPAAAATAAAAAIAARGFGASAPAAAAEAPALIASSGVTVRVVGPGAWAAAVLVKNDLARAPGVTAVGYAGVGRGAVALAVQGTSPEKAAAVAKATPGFSARTRVEDGVVVVRLQ